MSATESKQPWPPRVTVEIGVGGLCCPKVTSYIFRPFPGGGRYDFLSEAEHTHLLAEAVRGAKAETWDAAAHAALSIVDVEYYDYCSQKASELRTDGRKG